MDKHHPRSQRPRVWWNLRTTHGGLLEIFACAQELGERSRANPSDDITSALMAAEVDGDRLSPQEFGSFILLVVAGNETTRNALTHGLHALTHNPTNATAGLATSTPMRRLRWKRSSGIQRQSFIFVAR